MKKRNFIVVSCILILCGIIIACTSQKTKPEVYDWYAKGVAVEATNPKQALIYFKKALEIEPDHFNALHKTVNLLESTFNKFPEALEYLNRADQMYENNRKTHTAGYANLMMLFGIVYSRNTEFDRAIEYYKKSQKILEAISK